ncbi:MAG: Arylsulfatase [Planctomycetes bacterium ADurb.Bin126]|nr:MAG: Arylsulfatase [Planctomycetes bacterium ADurb.Bin126]HOD80687.1 arylsulfatase [Phycisphaerae bacterium]HQL74985.1 arylsulfatase [Phycisphaerae bacterium]
MTNRTLSVIVSALALASLAGAADKPATAGRPNIVFILADDIGYGDLGCYGATKIQTPRCDKLAKEGLRFTDAHSPAAVCTPTRYAFMTGQYAWRKKGTGILPGIAGLIVDPSRTTVPSMLKRAGYATGVVGKWHLGLGTTPTDYNIEIKPGPLEVGFDYAWLLPATGDRVPCVWVEDRRVVNLDPADPIKLDYSVKRGEPRSFVNGIPRIGGQTGGKAALWKDDEIADVITAKAIAFIEKNKDKPFFLYLPTHDIHVPRVPNARFRGTSQAGVRGDTVHSFDWTVGQVVDALDRLKLTERTLLIVTSDNGGVLDTNGPDSKNSGTVETNNGHAHNGPLRGNKGSAYEGGTRVPFIVSWPGRVKPGACDALICHVDMLASLAALTGQTLDADAGPDSFDVLPALLEGKAGRDHLVEQGNVLALRQGPWKLIPAPPAGKKRPARSGSGTQLYNLGDDIGETRNLADQNEQRVKEMTALLQRIQQQGKSRP